MMITLFNCLTVLLFALNMQCSDSGGNKTPKHEKKPHVAKEKPKADIPSEQPPPTPVEDKRKDIQNQFLNMCVSPNPSPETESTIRTLIAGAGFYTDQELLASLRANPSFIDDDDIYYGPISAEMCEKTNTWLAKQETLLLAYASDLTPIQALRKLKKLFIEHGKVSNFSPIAHNLNLEELNIIETTVDDPSHLGYMQTIKNLSLDHVPIENISWLGNLRALRYLTINHVQVKNWTPLGNLLGLEYLAINFSELNDLSFLQNYRVIKFLNLSSNEISDPSSIAFLSSLVSLEMGWNKIKYVDAFARLEKLSSLSIWNNQIENITPLANLKRLSFLTMGGNPLGTSIPTSEQNCPRGNNVSEGLNKFCSR